jgi:two-component system cell cycle sensor histidine kinase PleC
MRILGRSLPSGPVEARGPVVLAEQVKLLYQGSLAAPVNLLNAVIVAVALRQSYPRDLLIAWVVLTAASVGFRLILRREYRRAPDADRNAGAWARWFTVGALLSGVLWGSICFALPFFGTPFDFLFVTLVGGAMSAGAMTTMAPYFPAFLCYMLPFVVLPGIAFLITPGTDHPMLGVLMLIYAGVLAGTAGSLNRLIIRTLRLKIANAALHRSLSSTHAELDLARQDKWSTLAHLSHELRTPLTAILGFSESIRDQLFGPLGDPKYREYAAHVHSSGQHLLNLAGEILDLTQGESGALALSESDIDVAELVQGCEALVASRAEARRLRITCLVPRDLPLLRADATKIRQILLNLLTNAIKFTPPGGEVTITAGVTPDGAIFVSVADNGVGMAPDDIPRALAPFVRLANPLVQQTEGAGLGLPICKRLAEMHDAAFSIVSKPGLGTTCTVRFPESRSGSRASD